MLLSYFKVSGWHVADIRRECFGGAEVNVFLDCGAFSAQSTGAPINAHLYEEYVARNAPVIDVYVSLDVIGDGEASAVNWRGMRRRGLAPVPTFHVGDRWALLEEYLEAGGYVALGGLVPYNKRRHWAALWPWLERCMGLAEGRYGAAPVFHAFGIMSTVIMDRFRWRSMDSSAASIGARFGSCVVYDRQRHRFVSAPRDQVPRYARVIRAMGGDPRHFVPGQPERTRAAMYELAGASYAASEAVGQRTHGPGFRLYLAETDVSPRAYLPFFSGWWRERG